MGLYSVGYKSRNPWLVQSLAGVPGSHAEQLAAVIIARCNLGEIVLKNQDCDAEKAIEQKRQD